MKGGIRKVAARQPEEDGKGAVADQPAGFGFGFFGGGSAERVRCHARHGFDPESGLIQLKIDPLLSIGDRVIPQLVEYGTVC